MLLVHAGVAPTSVLPEQHALHIADNQQIKVPIL